MNLVVGGRTVKLTPAMAIGKGGEAEVFALASDVAIKVYKAPGHPDLAGDRAATAAAKVRIADRERKLSSFPRGLPGAVVAPRELAHDAKSGRFAGWTMARVRDAEPLLRWSDPAFRRGGVPASSVQEIFRALHATLTALHAASVVVGDFNDQNVLVTHARDPWLIDADSLQFGAFACDVFTDRFVDPLLCDPAAATPRLVKRFGADSDWYAFAALLFQSLLLVHPFGGIWRPADPAQAIPQATRPLKRVSVLHAGVRAPKVALSPSLLPDDLLARFDATFERDQRGPFPAPLLETLRWTRCTACGAEHARAVCPRCAGPSSPHRVVAKTIVRGAVTATRLAAFPGGAILAIAQDARSARWLAWRAGRFEREDGTTIAASLAPGVESRIAGTRTVLGRAGDLRILPGASRLAADAFDANARRLYWIEGGRLLREGDPDPVAIGDVLAGQTRFWTGDRFGLGFYRAGGVTVGFTFDAERPGIDDSLALPPIAARVVGAQAAFAGDRAWLLLTLDEGGRLIRCCIAVAERRRVVALHNAAAGDGSWLGDLAGAPAAAGDFLLVPTDDGIVRVEVAGSGLAVARAFPDTEPFVDAASRLSAGPQGLLAASRDELLRLQLTERSTQ